MYQNAFHLIFATLVNSHVCLFAWLEGSSQRSESSKFVMFGNITRAYMEKIRQPHTVAGNPTAVTSTDKILQRFPSSLPASTYHQV